jgi:MFS family permease
VAAPLYISEISPPDRRGRLTGMFQFNIVFGILMAFLSNWLLRNTGEHAWRWMMGSEALPALLYTMACFLIPESPRWLLSRGRETEAATVLRAMMPEADAAAVTAAADRIRTAPAVQGQRVEGLLSPTVRRPLMLAFLIAFFNQLSGINAVLYFAPRIFGLTGSENALGQSIGIGITNLVFTFAGLWLIDRLGRRTLLYIGSLGYILSLGLCAAAFFHWAPQFRAASAAVDLKNAAAALASANPARVDALRSDLSQRWNALAAAAADPRSGAASVPPPASFDPVNQREAAVAAATEVLTASSRAAGPGGTIVLLCIFAGANITLNDKLIINELNLNVLLSKASNSHFNRVLVFINLLDVVWRIV